MMPSARGTWGRGPGGWWEASVFLRNRLVRREVPVRSRDSCAARGARGLSSCASRVHGTGGVCRAPAQGPAWGCGARESGAEAAPVVLASWKDRRSEEHTSELQSRQYLVCRLLLEK